MSTGLTPETREEQYMAAAAGDRSAAGLPTPVTRKEIYLKAIADNAGGGGGGGFTPTDEQLAAMNSGITAEKLQEDENNIILIQGDITDIKSDIVSVNKVINWLSTTGSINILNATNTTSTAPSWIFQNVPCTLQANKEYILRYTTDKGIRLNFVGDKGSTRIFSIVYYASDGAGTFFKKFTPTDDVDKVGLYASDLPNGDTSISDMMIYSADLGELNYVPYAPSNIDLYKMIQAL